jgi:hypothetical protein
MCILHNATYTTCMVLECKINPLVSNKTLNGQWGSIVANNSRSTLKWMLNFRYVGMAHRFWENQSLIWTCSTFKTRQYSMRFFIM